jgi:hypothetical protein
LRSLAAKGEIVVGKRKFTFSDIGEIPANP